MRIMHLADLHLGKILNGYSLLADQQYILNQIIEIIDQQAIETVLIAGDIYDRSIAPKEAVVLYNDFIKALVIDRGLTVLAISGNHDSQERLEAGSIFGESVNYYLEGTFKKEVKRVTLQDDYGEIDFYLIAYAHLASLKYLLEKEEIEDFNQAYQHICQELELRAGVRSVVLAHLYLLNNNPEDGEISSQKPLIIGGKEFVAAEHFLKFDYVALGHLHRSQQCQCEKIRYAGTPLKYSFSEENHRKTVSIIDIKAKDEIVIEQIALEPLRDLRTIRGKFEQIVFAASADDKRDDYIRFILEDEHIVENAMSILKHYYPYAMELKYQFREKEIENLAVNNIVQINSMAEMVSDFYQEVYQEEMPVNITSEVEDIIQRIGEAD